MRPILAPGAHYGNRLKVSDFGGIILTDYEYSPGYRIPRHCHERAYMKLVLSGTCRETYENRTRDCRQSMLVFHPAGEPHSEQFGGGRGRTFGVEFGPRFYPFLQDRSAIPILDRPAEFQGGPMAWLGYRLYEEFQRPDPFSLLAVEGLTLEMIAAASRCLASVERRTPAPWLARAMEILRSDFTGNLSLSRIANEVGIHEVHLARAFRRHAHCSVGEYIRRLRIDFACQQLAASKHSLCEIALACGFADQSHFSRTFKRSTGMTPAAFRTSHRTRSGRS